MARRDHHDDAIGDDSSSTGFSCSSQPTVACHLPLRLPAGQSLAFGRNTRTRILHCRVTQQFCEAAVWHPPPPYIPPVGGGPITCLPIPFWGRGPFHPPAPFSTH